MMRVYKIAPWFVIGILPVILLVYRAGNELVWDGDVLRGIFSLQREGLLLVKTVVYSASVAAAATFIGVLAAAFICGPGKLLYDKFKWVVFLSLPIPGCIHSLAWLRLTGALKDLAILPIASRGWLISWFVQTMTLLPVAVLITVGGVFLINREQIKASQLLGSDTDFINRILPGYLKPQIMVSMLIVFLMTINDYAIPSIFSVNVYSLEIFVEYSSSLSMTRTLVKSLPLVLIEILLLLYIPGLLSKTFLSGRKGELDAVRLKPAKAFNLAGYLMFLIIIIQFIAPVSVLILHKSMWSSLGAVLSNSFNDLWSSLFICILAVLIGAPVIYLTADWLKGLKNVSTGLFFVLLPSVLPAAIMGTAFINMYNFGYTNGIYDSILMPVLAIMARFIPFGAIAVLAELKRIDVNLLNAAKILDRSGFRTAFSVKMPIVSTALIIGASFVFLFGLGELGATVMVLPPGISTITVRLYNYLHYGSSEMVLGISFILVLIITLVYLAIQLSSRSIKHDRAG